MLRYLVVILLFKPITSEFDITSHIERAMKCQSIPGVAVSIVKGRRTVYQKTFGPSINNSTLFCLGSLTKAFNAALLLRLSELGKVSLDNPLTPADISASIPPRSLTGSPVTLRQIVGQRTDLVANHYMVFFEFQHRNISNIARAVFDEALWPRYAKPASGRAVNNYNNLATAVSGHVVEKHLGQSWLAAMRRYVMFPLGVGPHDAVGLGELTPGSELASRLAQSSLEYRGKVEDVPLHRLTPYQNVAPAMGLCMSTDAVNAWLKFLVHRGKNILDRSVFDKFFVPGATFTQGASKKHPIFDQPQSYGLGWYSTEHEGYKVHWHEGFLFGYLSMIAFVPQLDLAVYVGTTGSKAIRDIAQLIRRIVEPIVLDHFPVRSSGSRDVCALPEVQLTYGYCRPVSEIPLKGRKADEMFGSYSNPILGVVHIFDKPVGDARRELWAHFGVMGLARLCYKKHSKPKQDDASPSLYFEVVVEDSLVNRYFEPCKHHKRTGCFHFLKLHFEPPRIEMMLFDPRKPPVFNKIE